MKKINLIATATFGLEAVVAHELKNLGYENTRTENARVKFSGTYEDICKTNLWLRCADRVQIEMGEFIATSFEELYQGVKALPWEEWLPNDAEFPVNGKSINSTLFSVSDCQAITKKAIVDRLKTRYKLDWFPETGPLYKIEVALLKDVVTLTIDSSGAGLHKRGYRTLTAKAPIKETLAAAMVSLSYWKQDRLLLDPLCGSGTIPIEAAMIGLNMAPGRKRKFAAEAWPQISPDLWMKARTEAEDLIIRNSSMQILGSDIDSEVLNLARYHITQAGVEKNVFIQKIALQNIQSKRKYGCIITNPGYGERIGDKQEAKDLARDMGKLFKPLDTWSFYVITPDKDFEKHIGRRADKKRKLYNGRIECTFLQFYGPRPPLKREEEVVEQ